MKHDFQFISKHSPNVKKAYKDLQDILNQVHRSLRNKYTFQHEFIGSYSQNIITYDKKSNVGYDFDINIYPNDEDDNFSAKKIKLLFKDALNKIATKYGYDCAEDSTRVLTIKVKDREKSRILYSVDFAFVNDYIDDEGYECQKYIRFNKEHNTYSWVNQSKGFYMLPERIDWLKKNNLWEKMKGVYIDKKNRNDDLDKHSRSLLAEAVNETYHNFNNKTTGGDIIGKILF